MKNLLEAKKGLVKKFQDTLELFDISDKAVLEAFAMICNIEAMSPEGRKEFLSALSIEQQEN